MGGPRSERRHRKFLLRFRSKVSCCQWVVAMVGQAAAVPHQVSPSSSKTNKFCAHAFGRRVERAWSGQPAQSGCSARPPPPARAKVVDLAGWKSPRDRLVIENWETGDPWGPHDGSMRKCSSVRSCIHASVAILAQDGVVPMPRSSVTSVVWPNQPPPSAGLCGPTWRLRRSSGLALAVPRPRSCGMLGWA